MVGVGAPPRNDNNFSTMAMEAASKRQQTDEALDLLLRKQVKRQLNAAWAAQRRLAHLCSLPPPPAPIAENPESVEKEERPDNLVDLVGAMSTMEQSDTRSKEQEGERKEQLVDTKSQTEGEAIESNTVAVDQPKVPSIDATQEKPDDSKTKDLDVKLATEKTSTNEYNRPQTEKTSEPIEGGDVALSVDDPNPAIRASVVEGSVMTAENNDEVEKGSVVVPLASVDTTLVTAPVPPQGSGSVEVTLLKESIISQESVDMTIDHKEDEESMQAKLPPNSIVSAMVEDVDERGKEIEHQTSEGDGEAQAKPQVSTVPLDRAVEATGDKNNQASKGNDNNNDDSANGKLREETVSGAAADKLVVVSTSQPSRGEEPPSQGPAAT